MMGRKVHCPSCEAEIEVPEGTEPEIAHYPATEEPPAVPGQAVSGTATAETANPPAGPTPQAPPVKPRSRWNFNPFSEE